jgi:hypothetical protein
LLCSQEHIPCLARVCLRQLDCKLRMKKGKEISLGLSGSCAEADSRYAMSVQVISITYLRTGSIREEIERILRRITFVPNRGLFAVASIPPTRTVRQLRTRYLVTCAIGQSKLGRHAARRRPNASILLRGCFEELWRPMRGRTGDSLRPVPPGLYRPVRQHTSRQSRR